MNRINSLARNLMHKSSSELIKLHHAGTTRIIELNRPAQLNSLNLDMVNAMTEALQVYLQSNTCTAVIIQGSSRAAEKRVFCAGGDVVSLWKAKQSRVSVEKASEFFRKEYALNHLIGTFSKPIISIMDGITSKNCVVCWQACC